MVVKIPVYVNFEGALSPDEVESIGIQLKNSFYKILQAEKSKVKIKFESQKDSKVNISIITRQEAEELIVSPQKKLSDIRTARKASTAKRKTTPRRK